MHFYTVLITITNLPFIVIIILYFPIHDLRLLKTVYLIIISILLLHPAAAKINLLHRRTYGPAIVSFIAPCLPILSLALSFPWPSHTFTLFCAPRPPVATLC